MLRNFSYVACEDKVLLYAYQIFEIINNQIHKINLLVIDQDHNSLGVMTAHEPSRGRCPAVCNARDSNTVKVHILGNVICSTILFNKF